MGRASVGVDILTKIDGVDFDATWSRRVEEVIDVASGLRANFLSREDLVSTKLAAGRPQDLADMAAIREADKTAGSR